MRIENLSFQELVKLSAGGPGSGRHPGLGTFTHKTVTKFDKEKGVAGEVHHFLNGEHVATTSTSRNLTYKSPTGKKYLTPKYATKSLTSYDYAAIAKAIPDSVGEQAMRKSSGGFSGYHDTNINRSEVEDKIARLAKG
jgi:hypothetical protein